MHELSKVEGQLMTLVLDRGDDVQSHFGFSLRGGVEHGVGHFVSSVDVGSIAESQGMKAGDQFLSVDRLPLASATHKEAVALISSRKKVFLYGFLFLYRETVQFFGISLLVLTMFITLSRPVLHSKC